MHYALAMAIRVGSRDVNPEMPEPADMPAVSLTERARRKIREDIIEGRIGPNVRLVAGDLAEQLQISRTPIREALQLLASEGLVSTTGRGFIVRKYTVGEVRHNYEVRAALEAMGARLAAERAATADIKALERIGAHRVGLVDDPRDLMVDLNDAFHEAIMRAAGNPALHTVNLRNSQRFFSYNIAKLYSREEARDAIRGHAAIVKAIKKRDGDAASHAARQHVFDALEITLKKLR